MTTGEKRVALVTGAARGIGLATALKFLAEGWQVALLDIDAETLTATYARIGRPKDTLAVTCDVAEPEQVNTAVETIVAPFGRIDALINNAGIADFRPILETDFETWSRILAVNLSGPFLCTQACAPIMLASGGGAVVNVVSISGFRASTLRVAYGTSKAGLMQLTRQQAAELGNVGIRVNAVASGPVDTAMAKKVHTPGDQGGLSRGDPAQLLRHRGGDRRGDLLPVQREGELRQRTGGGRGRRIRVDGDRVAGVAGGVGWVRQTVGIGNPSFSSQPCGRINATIVAVS